MKAEFNPGKFDHRQLAEAALAANSILEQRIATACKIDENQAPEILTEVIKYLNLTAYYEQRLTPSVTVDNAWHEFILCTKAYTDFCQTHFGKYIHHHPGGSDQENRNQFMDTLKRYREHFGKPPDKFWGLSSESPCGACESISE